MRRRLDRAAAPWFLLLLLLVPSLDLRANPQGALTDAQRLKNLQRQILLREPMERREALEHRGMKGSRAQRALEAGARARRPASGTEDLRGARSNDLFARARAAALSAVQTPTNTMMNDTTGEDIGSVQSEISMASQGNDVVAVWNDGADLAAGANLLGYGYSTDGGSTWTDGGAPPNTGIGTWASDPVIVVNEKTGDFYFSGLADQSANATNSVAVVRGSFQARPGLQDTFVWATPAQVSVVPNNLALLDKEWVAVDSLSGNVYCSYSYFAGNTDEIRVQRSMNRGQSWQGAITLSSANDAGLVQGSRPSIGPAGEVYVVWHAIGLSNNVLQVGPDFLRMRRSDNFGVTFQPEVTPTNLFSNFGSGGPGFNRGLGITFPGIAVDRSTGAHRGRVYVSWSEAVDFADDNYPRPGIDPFIGEAEPNNSALQATAFIPGEILHGVVSLVDPNADLDYFKWNATQGTTYAFWVDSLSSTLDASLRVFCSDAAIANGPEDNLAFSQNGQGGEDFIVFTAPTTGTYFLRIASYSKKNTGTYRIRTTVHTAAGGRARDERDVFVAYSDDGGTSWSQAVRANDSPPWFDDFLPEVAVDGRGRVFVDDYDYRDATAWCGGGSNAYLYESDDGGASFGPGQRMSSFTSRWAFSYSTLIPNQGDYVGLFARDSVVFAAWADIRAKGDPDAFMARLGTICGAAPITALSAVETSVDSLLLTWAAANGTVAELLRREGNGPFADLGPLTANASNRMTYLDTTVVLGHTYTYRLGTTGYCLPYAGEITVTIVVPHGPGLAINGVWPNPFHQKDVLTVSFQLDGSAQPATVSLHDISGREVKRMTLTGQGTQVLSFVSGSGLEPGIYFVRITQGGTTRSKRVSFYP